MDRSVILKRFKATPSQRPQALREAPFSRLNRQVRAAVPNPSSEAAKSLSQTLHQLHTQIALVTDENEGLREALSAKKKHRKKGKPLALESEELYNGGAVWWSPTKVQQARDRQRRKEEDKRVAEAAKRTRKELQATAKLLKEKEKEERRVERERLKEVRDREKAAKEAAKTAKKDAQNTKKAPTTAQTGKRKASKAHLSTSKRPRRSGVAAARAASPEAALAAH
jgi:hypothetical protein